MDQIERSSQEAKRRMARLFEKQLAKNENQIYEPEDSVPLSLLQDRVSRLKRLNFLQQAETPPQIGENEEPSLPEIEQSLPPQGAG